MSKQIILTKKSLNFYLLKEFSQAQYLIKWGFLTPIPKTKPLLFISYLLKIVALIICNKPIGFHV